MMVIILKLDAYKSSEKITMKKILFIFLFISINAHASSKLNLSLDGLNAELDEGFGQVSLEKVFIHNDPIKAVFENVNYELSMEENFFYIKGPNHQLDLDLKSFKKIFEEQKFKAINSHLSFNQGIFLKLISEYFDIAVAQIKLNFFEIHINCSPKPSRDIAGEILSLCLKKAEATISKGILAGRSDIIINDEIINIIQQTLPNEKLAHLPKILRPEINQAKININNGELTISTQLKLIANLSVNGLGFVEYHAKENVITLKINSLASENFNLKPITLKALKLLKNDFFEVKEDVLIFNLNEMRANSAANRPI